MIPGFVEEGYKLTGNTILVEKITTNPEGIRQPVNEQINTGLLFRG